MGIKKLSLDEVMRAIAFDQPKLKATQNGQDINIEGHFLVLEDVKDSCPGGPITEFEIKISVSRWFPHREPIVSETAGRIPRIFDRHIINTEGVCCVTVWEEWLVEADDLSFAAYLNGPLREYFLSQYWFEKTGKWPFGERSHYGEGLFEAYADVLKIPNRKRDIIYHLRLLSQDWPKGHWLCPCGSAQLLRYCHRDDQMALHQRVAPHLARRMLKRLRLHLSPPRKR